MHACNMGRRLPSVRLLLLLTLSVANTSSSNGLTASTFKISLKSPITSSKSLEAKKEPNNFVATDLFCFEFAISSVLSKTSSPSFLIQHRNFKTSTFQLSSGQLAIYSCLDLCQPSRDFLLLRRTSPLRTAAFLIPTAASVCLSVRPVLQVVDATYLCRTHADDFFAFPATAACAILAFCPRAPGYVTNGQGDRQTDMHITYASQGERRNSIRCRVFACTQAQVTA